MNNHPQQTTHQNLLPVIESQRLNHIDIIRGVAILGILLMNIIIFGLPESSFGTIYGWSLGSPLNNVSRIITFTFFDGNMRGLFCLLFGAGIILFSQQCERNNSKIFPLFRRMWWLLLFGLFDIFVVLWQGDILYEYALCGLLLIFLRKLKPLYLLLISFCILIYFNYQNITEHYKNYDSYKLYTKNEALYNSDQKLTKEQKENKNEWGELRNIFHPYSKKQIAEFNKKKKSEIAERNGNYLHVFKDQSKYWKDVIDPDSYMVFLSEIMVMLVGMALFKKGWISTTNRRRNQIMAGTGLFFGVCMSSYIAYSQPLTLTELNQFMGNNLIYGTIFYSIYNLLITLGFMGLILLFCSSKSFKGIKSALASTGKMAFTNYFMQSIICTLIFNGYGLGLYGQLERYQLYFVVPFVWIINVLFSMWWMKRYNYGPFEWVWRTLTYWKKIPNKKLV